MASYVHSFLNGLRDISLSRTEIKDREAAKGACSAVKLASIVASIASVYFFTIFPSLFNFVSIGLTIFLSTECYKVADNTLEVLSKALTEAESSLSEDKAIEQITKGTYLAKSIIQIVKSLLINEQGE